MLIVFARVSVARLLLEAPPTFGSLPRRGGVVCHSSQDTVNEKTVKVTFRRPPEPTDVIWENLGCNDNGRCRTSEIAC